MNINSNISQSNNYGSLIIKDIVLQNFKAAELMEKYGIDFCCKGKRPLDEALKEKAIDSQKFIAELENSFIEKELSNERYEEWDLHFLAQYIVNNHHFYVRSAAPTIMAHLEKLKTVHGAKYGYLADVQFEFAALAEDMTSHMYKEERILFPIIKYLVDSQRFNERPKTDGYGTIKNPIMQMESEHNSAGVALENIRTLTDNFAFPEDACTTFKVTYSELEAFEKDLHKHVHLENNILFPKAIELEEKLLRNQK